MKIRKLKENLDPFNINNDDDDNISIEIEFSGKRETTLNDIKYTDYYREYYDEDMTAWDLKKLIFYSAEQYIYEKGVGGFNIKIYDENGKEIDIDLYLKANKYNL
jgi:hypothetical protein